MANYTGKSLEQIEQDTERDFYMSAQEAVAYGLIDRVIERPTLAIHPELVATRELIC